MDSDVFLQRFFRCEGLFAQIKIARKLDIFHKKLNQSECNVFDKKNCVNFLINFFY